MMNITAIVPAIHIKKSIADLIALGISSRCTSHLLSLLSDIHRIFSASSAKVVLAELMRARII
jgi:hypothetical protein